MNSTRLPVSMLALAWRQTWRDFRAGELRLLMVAVVLAVASLTAVGFFASRLDAALARDARAMLGGDAVIASDQAAPPDFAAQAKAGGLKVSASANFPSMGRARDEQGGQARLVSLKAVDAQYPLRGAMRVRAGPDAPIESLPHGPSPGQVWVEPGLLDVLGLAVGDQLLLGDASFSIAKLIVQEPDRGAGFMNFAPRVMLNAADLQSTGLVQPASRITYRLAVAGDDNRQEAVAAYGRWVQARNKAAPVPGLRLESLETGRPEMRQTLDRAGRFLNLVALLAALLAAVAVAIAARDYAQRHLDDSAMLRVLGAPQRAIAGAYTLQFGAVGLIASLVGVLVGFALHFVFVQLLTGLMDTQLPAATPLPALFGLGVGMTLLVAFGLPPVLQLAQVPPLRVIRRDLGGLRAAPLGVLAAGGLGFAGLLLAVSSDITLGLLAVGGFAGAVLAFALLGFAAVMVLRRVVPSSSAPRALVLATRQLSARPAFAVLQISALGVGLLALILLVLLRTDLIAAWRNTTPADAPDRFVINIQPEQSAPFQAALRGAGVTKFDLYPMIRGRLVAINGDASRLDNLPDERARRWASREFNLSHSTQLPANNQVVAGQWQPDEANALSVETSMAESLGMKLGDSLRFDIAGQIQEGRITSLRKVDWGSMRVNFYVMWAQGKPAPGLPLTYVSAFKAPPAGGFDSALVRQFPNITNVDVSASIAQVQRVLDQVILAVEFLFGFTLAAGLVVLFAAVAATRENRAREYAVMRAVGASSSLLRAVQRAELLGVGALSGFLAAAAAMVLGGAMARRVFEFAWTPSLWVLVAGTALGALLALAAGWWGLREVLRRPVMDTLRRAAD